MAGLDQKGVFGWAVGAWAAALVVGLVFGSPGMAVDSEPKTGNGKALTPAGSQGERGQAERKQIVARPAIGFESATGNAELGERLVVDCRDGRVEEFDFLEASLIASGVDSKAELAEWLGAYRPVREGMLASLPAGTATERLKAIHAGVHRFVLTGYYKSAASDLRTTLTSGDFNCLTSLVVCSDLCRGAGLNVQARLVRGHVFLVIETAPGRVLAMEPGTPQWVVRALDDAGRERPLTEIELLGKFFYNRGVLQLQTGRFAEGTGLLRTSLLLDARDEDARTNLAAGLNNWAVEHCREKRFSDAAALIEQGLSLDPHFAPLVANEQLVRGKLGK